MGHVISLDQHRRRRRAPHVAATPEFFFDVACPLSYLAAERVERLLDAVEWIPVDGAALYAASGAERREALRVRADASARELRLPLVWPEGGTLAAGHCARRATSFACEIGAGGSFALAASRLAFCGGFDLDDPETLAEAAAAAGVPLEECLAAAGEADRDEALLLATDALRDAGIDELPAVRVGDHWFSGDTGLLAAAAMLGVAGVRARGMAPVC